MMRFGLLVAGAVLVGCAADAPEPLPSCVGLPEHSLTPLCNEHGVCDWMETTCCGNPAPGVAPDKRCMLLSCTDAGIEPDVSACDTNGVCVLLPVSCCVDPVAGTALSARCESSAK